jgi:segregation and condensation protein A
VSEKIEALLKLTADAAAVTFGRLFEEAASRAEIICTFLALLELIRLKQLICVQSEDFGEIEILRAPPAPAPAQEAAPN